ncbi:hypothetical protein [Streptomyces mirabilis]|uniref:hypothetical protein n=1 Tax=Streptomyces mirabilis TaxID=68239 RepID=UPI00224EA3D7|nr:hypothetical protein [Streptomyces mirabilis]MCX4419260.1 hypothetical protein [Streptomyces mirabilis]
MKPVMLPCASDAVTDGGMLGQCEELLKTVFRHLDGVLVEQAVAEVIAILENGSALSVTTECETGPHS